MRRAPTVISFVALTLPLGIMVLTSLHAQERGQFTDFRGRGNYTEEDLARSLFQQAPSDVRTRGIAPHGIREVTPELMERVKANIRDA